MAAPVLGGLALGVGAIIASVGLVVLPFYGSYKLHQKLQQRKQAKRRRQICEDLRRQMQGRQGAFRLNTSQWIMSTESVSSVIMFGIVA